MNFKLEDFIKLSEEKKEIRHIIEKVNGVNLHIFHYMIATPDLFKTEIERECRGITFDDNGNCLCRPFHKFFNIGEKEETLPENIDWNNIEYVSEKIDGSLVCPVIVNGKIFWKTKKSFYSNIAIKLQKAWDNKEEWIYKYHDDNWDFWNLNATLLLEYVSSDNRIVIDYEETNKLLYIGVRDIVTGKYYINHNLNNLYYVNFLKEKKDAYKYFIENIKETPLIEGYVLYTKDKLNAYKLKTQWYLDRHHLLTSLSYREIIQLISGNKIDDIISELRLKGFTKQIEIINNVINQYTYLIAHEYNIIYEIYNNILDTLSTENGYEINRKDFALKASKNSYAHFLFALYDNRIEQLDNLISKSVCEYLTEIYKHKVLFMGIEN